MGICAKILLTLLVLLHTPGATAQTPSETSHAFPHYDIDVVLDADLHQIRGTLELGWINHTGESQESLWFRTYPNAPYYAAGETVIESAAVDGEDAEFALQPDPTVLEVELESPVEPDQQVTVTLEFETTIPVNQQSGFGIFQHDTVNDIWNLADWYPVLAGWEPESGWYLQEPTMFGDPTFSETATYDVAIELPDELTQVSTGEVSSWQTGFAGTTRYYVETDPAREFVMTLIEDDAHTTKVEADDVTVQVTLPEDYAVEGLAEFMAETASAAIEHYERLLGEYPSAEFDLSVAELTGGAAVSWSGITWFDLTSVVADGVFTEEEEVALAFVILHEVGHQWIADVIGSNNNDHGFMSEGLVNALAVLAAEKIYGPERAEQYLTVWVAGPYMSLLRDERDAVADAPLTNETNGVIRSLVVYGKGGLGFIAIYNEIGEADFEEALALFGETYRFGVADPEDLLEAFETASGDELDDLWSFWFLEAEVTLPDAEQVIEEYVSGR